MKCKKHLSDLSSVVGVCATCLREKLFVLIEAQSHLQQAQEQRRQNSNANPAPQRIVFPQSVSPEFHLSRHGLADQRFFHATPQVGPTGELISGNEYANKKDKKKKMKNSRFSLFNHMFRSKSGNLDSDNLDSNSDDQCNTMPSSSPSWLSTILAGRRGKKTRSLSLDEATIGVRRRTLRNCDRGMSPVRYSDEENYQGGSSGESSPAWKQTPRRTPAYQRGGGGGGKASLSRNAFCLSPLVWASPNQRWNQKGMPPAPEMVYPGEIRSPAKSRFHNATSFCKNRSRKLADFGRSRHNH